MQLNTHLNFNGQCEAAFKFYERAMGGKITSITIYGSTPAGQQVPADWRDKIMHAEMKIGDAFFMDADVSADRTSRRKASRLHFRPTNRPKRIAYFRRFLKTATCACPSDRPSGLRDSECSPISSEYRGW